MKISLDSWCAPGYNDFGGRKLEFIIFHIDKSGRKFYRALHPEDCYQWQPLQDKAEHYSLNEASDLIKAFSGDCERDDSIGIKRVL